MKRLTLLLLFLSIAACTSVPQDEQNKTPERIKKATGCEYPEGDCPNHHRHEGHDAHHHSGYPEHDFELHF